MAKTSRQTAIFGTEDWKRLYKTYNEADLQSYNFETIRKTFVDYLRQHHPETFNDYTESSEFIAILDLMAFMGQSLSFRNDVNTRENFMDTAERRDSVVNLAKLIGYTPKRNETATGFLKVLSVTTTENVIDFNRNNLSNVTLRWNDRTNDDWQEQFTTVLNAALVDSQRIGQPGRSAKVVGVDTDEYELNMAEGFLPVLPFSANVDGQSMAFEVINSTSVNSDSIYEPAPKANGPLNILYRNDNQGFASADTGYFFNFKQGTLEVQEFTLAERIANRAVEIEIPGINNADIWLYKIDEETNVAVEEWTEVENIYTSNGAQLESEERKFFSVTSRVEDRITFNFGDGVFSQIPVGTFRAYLRQSNGLEYVINPEEIQNVDINVSYLSRAGRNEVITLTVGLTSPVTNAKDKELISDIKRRAPARFYTQNRMVNGEDYNNFPYTEFGSIIKSKAINRSSIGTSRYLDLVDPTGKYSSINTFSDDGLMYKEKGEESFTFTFANKNDIASVFRNELEPLIADRGMIQFYYEEFSRIDLVSLDLIWDQNTVLTNETSGYFKSSAGNAQPIGPFVSDDRQYLVPNALVKFIAPSGFHFNVTNRLIPGTVLQAGDKDYIWATLTSVENEGTAGGAITTLPDNTVGPVKLNNFVPTGALPVEVIPLFNSDLPPALEQEMLTQVELLRDFGIGFDHLINKWYIITTDNLDADAPFDLSFAQSQTNANEDASWAVKFISTPSGYEVTGRTLHYFFASVLQTRFFFDGNRKIFDTKTGKVINDFVKMLKTNTRPGSNAPLTEDVAVDIIGQTVETDGFVNDYNVEISYTDSDNDGIADDPDFFRSVVNEASVSADHTVYFEATVDFDNLERYLPIDSNLVIDEYATEDTIALVKTEHVNGQVFYATAESKFFELVVDSEARNLVERTDMKAKTGRDHLQFQYRHNSPETRRINPGTTNIIDLYIVTASYYASYSRYVQDSTNTVDRPSIPTTDELSVAYSSLQSKKMVSDNIVFNSVQFKPLFGSKAESNLQAYIKVVKLPNAVTSDSEIKSKVISEINNYFAIDNWDFGDTFYFSELSAYIHQQLGDLIGSVVIVSKDPTKNFGNLYEIKSAPNEIFTSSATVNDVNIIDALTASKLQNKAG